MNYFLLNGFLCLLLASLTWFGFPATTLAGEVLLDESPTVLAPPPTAAKATPPQPSALDVYKQVNETFEAAFKATREGDFATAEKYWTEVIEQFPEMPAAWSNRGNAKVSQNKVQSAIADYDKAIEIAPEIPDPYINRGIALEALGKYKEAIANYDKAIELDPKEAITFNNRGNAKAGMGNWEDALTDFKQAIALSRDYAFARGNYALALYQLGQTDEAVKTMRFLVRKYPQFADMRAALTAALWAQGKQGEAESQWVSVVGLDSRYKDLTWLKTTRRWSPKMIAAMEKFLTLKSEKLETAKDTPPAMNTSKATPKISPKAA